ncbi:root hair specific 12 [Actinidia rufa]|uniref:Root hair specific 12 n=1 Tax=Actinidia rufa TaxID=165716 RepID=A0A7J0GVJ8_9ERIC|nr:root hair specific 12 [Actinidia rufa]
MNKKTIGQIRQFIGHEHDETSAHELWTKLEEMYREKTSQNKALMRRLVLKLQRGTTVGELTSEFQKKCQRRGQRRGLKKEVTEVRKRGGTRRIVQGTKHKISLQRAATTTMMAVESDVLLAASADEDMRGTCTDSKQYDEELLAKEQSNSAWQTGDPERGRKTEGLYRLEGNVQTGGAAVRHESSGISKKNGRGKQPLHRGTQSKRRNTRKIYLKDPEWYRSARRCFEKRAKVWLDKSDATSPKSQMEAPSSSIVKNVGMYKLNHELIFSSMWHINSDGCLKRSSGQDVILGKLLGVHSMLLCAKVLGECTQSRERSTEGGSCVLGHNTAVVLQNCNILPKHWPSGNLSSVRTFLGRPWKNYSTTVYMGSIMGSFIDPKGLLPWTGDTAPDTIFYAEYKNFGPGSSTKNRVKWKGLRNMTNKQATKFTVESFIDGDKWLPETGVKYEPGL